MRKGALPGWIIDVRNDLQHDTCTFVIFLHVFGYDFVRNLYCHLRKPDLLPRVTKLKIESFSTFFKWQHFFMHVLWNKKLDALFSKKSNPTSTEISGMKHFDNIFWARSTIALKPALLLADHRQLKLHCGFVREAFELKILRNKKIKYFLRVVSFVHQTARQ